MNRHADVLIVQHVAVESPGLILEALDAARLGHRVVRSGEGEAVPATVEPARGVVVMGGPMGVRDAERLPFLRAEMRLIEDALRRERPVLGVCLGSQLLAAVLGAKVVPSPRKEIGWHPVTVEAEAARADEVFAGLPQTFVPLHWHGDIFDLPEGSARLARSEMTATQAFRYGEHTYGLLFHLEVTPRIVADMVRAFDDELREVELSGGSIVDEAKRRLPALEPLAARVFGAWARRVRLAGAAYGWSPSRRAEGPG